MNPFQQQIGGDKHLLIPIREYGGVVTYAFYGTAISDFNSVCQVANQSEFA